MLGRSEALHLNARAEPPAPGIDHAARAVRVRHRRPQVRRDARPHPRIARQVVEANRRSPRKRVIGAAEERQRAGANRLADEVRAFRGLPNVGERKVDSAAQDVVLGESPVHNAHVQQQFRMTLGQEGDGLVSGDVGRI